MCSLKRTASPIGIKFARARAGAGLPFRSKHWATVRMNYSKAPFFDQHARFFEHVYARPWRKLNDLMREITEYLLDAFNIGTQLHFTSDMKLAGNKNELVLNLCHEVGATLYVSGPLGKNYLREELF